MPEILNFLHVFQWLSYSQEFWQVLYRSTTRHFQNNYFLLYFLPKKWWSCDNFFFPASEALKNFWGPYFGFLTLKYAYSFLTQFDVKNPKVGPFLRASQRKKYRNSIIFWAKNKVRSYFIWKKLIELLLFYEVLKNLIFFQSFIKNLVL